MKAIELIDQLIVKGASVNIPQNYLISKITQDTREIDKTPFLLYCGFGAKMGISWLKKAR